MKAENIRYLIELLELREKSLTIHATAAEEKIPDATEAKQTGVELRTVIRREQEIRNELGSLFYDRSTAHSLGCVCPRCKDYATRAAVQSMQRHTISLMRRQGKKIS